MYDVNRNVRDRETLVIFSTVTWDFLWQRHQTIATYFAERGWNVIFVQGISGAYDYLNPYYYLRALRKLWRILAGARGKKSSSRDLPENVRIHECTVAPLQPHLSRMVNARILAPREARSLAEMCERDPVVLNYHPTETAKEIARGLHPKLLVYDCVMNYEAATNLPPDILDTERWWIEEADLVFVDSAYLKNKHENARDDMIRLPPGVDFDLFNRAFREPPKERYKSIGYFGGMGEGWFDFDLVCSVADRGFEVLLVGERLSEHHLFDHPNVTCLSAVPQHDLPEILSSLDALLMPYLLNEFTRGVFPSKVYECLATGKPVLSTSLPDLVDELSGSLYFVKDADEIEATMLNLPEAETSAKVERRIEVARDNSWNERLKEMEREIENRLRSVRVTESAEARRG